jgi:FkbM family methyltransferase
LTVLQVIRYQMLLRISIHDQSTGLALVSINRFLANNALLKREKLARLIVDIPRQLLFRFDPRLRAKSQEWSEITSRPPGLVQTNGRREKWIVFSNDQAISRELFLNGEFDFNKLERAWRIIPSSRRKLALIDVGANLGTICIPAVSRGLFRTAVAIEANPSFAEVLEQNVVLNGLEHRIQVFNSAVGPEDSQSLSFSVEQSNFGASRVVNSPSEQTLTVRSSTLYTLLGNISNVGLVFMDIEGFEGEALKGARRLLEDCPPLALEFTPKLISHFTSRDEFCTLLSSYSCFYSLNDPLKKYLISELPRVWDWFLGEEGWEQTDLLFL